MRLPLLTLWESGTYWNGDNIGSSTGANNVMLPSSVAITLIGECANHMTLPSSVGLCVIGESSNSTYVEDGIPSTFIPPTTSTYMLMLALTSNN